MVVFHSETATKTFYWKITTLVALTGHNFTWSLLLLHHIVKNTRPCSSCRPCAFSQPRVFVRVTHATPAPTLVFVNSAISSLVPTDRFNFFWLCLPTAISLGFVFEPPFRALSLVPGDRLYFLGFGFASPFLSALSSDRNFEPCP
jgi:hypothetical protein